ncbi:unnamed protein product [Linum trigynum]|uniref:Uncharacterized protein n=1 Tax=Linum trigynum TaxID=586398 RepID=A0AAV2G752_9ROSI
MERGASRISTPSTTPPRLAERSLPPDGSPHDGGAEICGCDVIGDGEGVGLIDAVDERGGEVGNGDGEGLEGEWRMWRSRWWWGRI